MMLSQTAPRSRTQRTMVDGVKEFSAPVKSAGPREAVPVETRKNVAKCLEVLVTLFKIYGFREDNYKLIPTVDHWMKLCVAVGGPLAWMKVAKYKIAAFFSAQLGLEVPAAPWAVGTVMDNPRIILSGIAYRWVRLLASIDKETHLSLCTSVLYSKKGFPRPGKLATKAGEKATLAKLFYQQPPAKRNDLAFSVEAQTQSVHVPLRTPNTRSEFHRPVGATDLPEDFPHWRRTKLHERQWRNFMIDSPNDRLEKELLRTVDELFEGVRLTKEDLHRPTFPSTSANYVRSRMNAGSVGEIMSREDLLQGLTGKLDLTVRTERSFNERTNVFSDRQVLDVKSDRLDDDYSVLYDRCLDAALVEAPLIKPVGLEEPLKVRVITAGPPLTMFVMKPMQKITHTVLKRNPAFSLIAEPVSEKYLLDRLGRILKPDESYLSGDYSDATNSMYSWVSNVIADRICDHLLKDLENHEMHENFYAQRVLARKIRVLYRRSLTGHWRLGDRECTADTQGKRLERMEEKCEEKHAHLQSCFKCRPPVGDVFEQVHGQLMGSVTSFPVLCIANAALCRFTTEIGNRQAYSLASCPLMVNGDDCLMRTTELGHKAWLFFGPYLGLEPSLGKYYWSQKILNVNSQGFERVAPYSFNDVQRGVTLLGYPVIRERLNVFRMTRYVNLGLLFGMKRACVGSKAVVNTADAFSDYSLGTRSWELKHLTPPKLWKVVYADFMKRTKEALKASGSVHVPWYVPAAFGGLGIVPPEEGLSLLDRQICLKMVSDPKIGFGVKMNPPASWNVHRVVMGNCPVKEESGLRTDRSIESEARTWDSVYGRMCVSVIFGNKLEDVFTEDPHSDPMRTLRKNERHWAKTLKKGSLPGRDLALKFDPYTFGQDICSFVPCTLNV